MNSKAKCIIKFDDDKEDQKQKESALEQSKQIKQKKEKKKKEEIIKQQSDHTIITIALPDSIVSNAQSSELRSYFISQLARTFAMFQVDNVIILKDYSYITKSNQFDATAYVARNLQYLETPQYLRKHLFPIHADLKNVGLMNPIESKHHLKADERFEYREGVVVDRPSKEESCWVEIGLKNQVRLPYQIVPGTRVTIKLDDVHNNKLTGVAVSSDVPKQLGTYWGYTVTIQSKLDKLLKNDYDIKILIESDFNENFETIDKFNYEEYEGKNALIVFSGFDSIEKFISNDEKSKINFKDIINQFDHVYCVSNVKFGVKNLRLEEQIFMLLQKLRNI